jgi:signal peptidase II
MLKWLWLTLLIIIADQITKGWVSASFAYRELLPITPFFNLTLAHNPGAAFSFLSNAGGWQRWFFSAVALGISVAILIWLKRLNPNERLLACALALILGGAIGNLIDRVVYGYVIDFLDFHLAGYHWPAFNVADSAIVMGAALLIGDSFRQREHPP